jgi:hypothetical protein
LEQANLIQSYIEKKLAHVYNIDEMIGKKLSKSLVNYDEDFDDNEHQTEKSSMIIGDENLRRTKIDTINEDKLLAMETINNMKNTTIKADTHLNLASSINLTNQRSPSPSKSNLSPGEIKAISPSSLSDASPISS